MPPLTLADFASLLLPLPDETQTPVGPPAGQPSLTVTYPGGPHVQMVHLAPLPGAEPPDSRGDYGTRIHFGIQDPGAGKFRIPAPPKTGDDLPHSDFTRKKKYLFDFSEEDRGKTVYFCLRYENSKGGDQGKGPWGPILSAIIP